MTDDLRALVERVKRALYNEAALSTLEADNRLEIAVEALQRTKVFLQDCIKEPSLVGVYTLQREADILDTALASCTKEVRGETGGVL